MEGLHTDVLHSIATYLEPRDLCTMMRLSHLLCHIFVADRAWLTQKRRICTRFPDLAILFDAHVDADGAAHMSGTSMKRNSNKKRKTAWLMPRKGIWYVFKHWLAKGCKLSGLRALLHITPHKEPIDALIYAFVRLGIPPEETILRWDRMDDEWWHGHKVFEIIIHFTTTKRFHLTIKRASQYVACGLTELTGTYWGCSANDIAWKSDAPAAAMFKQWASFILH